MNSDDPNIVLVELVAAALGPMREHLVFLGGCATGLLITDAGRSAVRATKDVDLIAEVASIPDYYQLQTELKKSGFREDPEVSCRWQVADVKVDVMPTEEKFLGFSNRWYPLAIKQSNEVVLPSSLRVKVVSPPLFLATKLEAFYGRGNGDYGSSHDIEDILTLVDGRPELVAEVSAPQPDVRSYLREEVDDLLADEEFISTVSWHLSPDAASQARVSFIIDRLRQIAGL